MKDAKTYEKKVKKLLGSLKAQSKQRENEDNLVVVLMRAVLTEDAEDSQVAKAFGILHNEYVDYNELRVSPPKDIVELVGRNYPGIREKASYLVGALNAIFEKSSTLSLEYMDKMPKRDLRRHLQEIGLSPFASASVVLFGFGGHAIPVDWSLATCLEMDKCIHPGSDLEDIQGFLERIVSQKYDESAYEALRAYVKKNAKPLEKKRAAQAEAEAQAEAKAQKRAEEKAAAELAAAEARAAEAHRAEAEKRAAKKKTTRKASVKKAAPAKVKKTTRKKSAAEKASPTKVKKTAKKKSAAKKVAKKKAVKKRVKKATVKKAVKKTAKKKTAAKKTTRKKTAKKTAKKKSRKK